jgi:hypothetical protein
MGHRQVLQCYFFSFFDPVFFTWGIRVQNRVFGRDISRVTRCGCEKIAQKIAQ